MRALLLKDIYVLVRQMKVFLVLLLLLTLVFKEQIGSIAICYAMMLPVTSLAYDEQAKWPQMALMMPYSVKDMVLSKYVLGWGLGIIIALASMLVMFFDFDMDYFWVTVLVFCVALWFLAFMLPLMFWQGTEKGRLLMIAIIAGLFGIISAIGYISISFGGESISMPVLLAFLVATALINLLSVLLSIKLYKRRLVRG